MTVSLRNVCKDYGDVHVLRGLDLEVADGEVVVIIGVSGSGKSTILRLMSNLEEVTSGEIWVCDVPVHDRKRAAEVHNHAGMVFQQFNLFPHLTAIDNVSLALRKAKGLSRLESREQALEALSGVGMSDKAASYPSQLSGGQQQRVAIARALALRPRLMLFDEATSALDPELVGEVTGVMRDLADKGMTMVIVTHEMHFAREVADRVVFIDEGKVIEQGPPAVVLERPESPRTRQFLDRVINV